AGIRIGLKPNEVLFENGPVILYSRLVEGKFPPYRDIIPKKFGTRLTLYAPDFLAVVRQAAIMTDDQTKRVDFSFEPGILTLRAQGADTGSSEVSLELPEYTGSKIDIAFDPSYLVEMLRAIEGTPTIQLDLTDKRTPAVFRAGDNYLYLVMPMGD
ncbi:MAG: DNA polymerase III subunit beta, partial [Gemmataceae bacterium]